MSIDHARVDLGFLHMVKVILTQFIVFAHSCFIAISYVKSLNDKIEYATRNSAQVMSFIGAKIVETFFLIFGLLRSYTFLQKSNSQLIGDPLIWLKLILLCMIRVIPTYMFVHWYVELISPYTGSGPYWDYGLDERSMKGHCMRDSTFWNSLPPLVNIVPYCLGPGWFLVVYTKIAVVLPAVVYVIYSLRNQLTRIVFVSFIVACSVAFTSMKMLNQTVISYDNISAYGALLIGLFNSYQDMGYTSPLSRIGVVAIGCLLGCWLHQYEIDANRQWPRIIRSKMIKFVTYTMNVAVLLLLPVAGPELESWSGKSTNMKQVVISNAVLSVLWPCLNSLLVIYLSTALKNDSVKRFCNHPLWQVISKLGLCILLIHLEILLTVSISPDSGPMYESWLDAVKTWTFTSFCCLIMAPVIHVLFEIPVTGLLLRIVIGRHSTVEPKKS